VLSTADRAWGKCCPRESHSNAENLILNLTQQLRCALKSDHLASQSRLSPRLGGGGFDCYKTFMNFIRCSARLAGMAALALLGAAHTSFAQSSTQTAPKLNSDAFKLSPHYDLGTFDANESARKDNTGFALPNKIDLGNSELQFDASRKDNIPRGGLDNSDTSPLKAGIPSRNDSQIPPAYFGFTLSKPTR
jgi:hypothetical protein